MVQYRTGTTFFGISQESIGDFPLTFPPISHQRTIAAFLDRKTDEIDAVVARKERMIELLREERQALISHALTRGLDDSVPLKDSGIDSVGSIPAHWKVARNKLLFREIDERSEDGREDLLTVSHLRGVGLRSDNPEVTMFLAESHEGYKRCQTGDLVINTMWAFMGAVGSSPRHGIVSPAYNVYRPTGLIRPAFADLLFRTPEYKTEIRRYSKGVWTSRLRLYPEAFLGMSTALPPIEEQDAIVEMLRQHGERTDRLISACDRLIARLREYRHALISAAVTGKYVIPLEETPDFRAVVLAAEVVYRLSGTDHLGTTKLHKALYAAEHECDLVGFGSDFARMPFGPYDARLRKAVEEQLEARQWYKVVKGKKHTYVPLAHAGEHRAYFEKMYGDKADAITRLIDLLRPLNKNQVERAFTLYAAWNDFLIRGEAVDDNRLLDEVQYHWHPEKEHKEESWRKSLAWLKSHKLIPHGFGRPTRPTDAVTGLRATVEDEPDDGE